MGSGDALTYRLAVGRRFGERMLHENCVLQSGAAAFAGFPCTVIDGEVKTLTHVNALVAMQVMCDRGLVDPRFYTLAEIDAAGWSLGKDAVGIGVQYLDTHGRLSGNGLENIDPVSRRFKVFHASDVTGCMEWERSQPVKREDLVAGLTAAGVIVPGDENGLAIALQNWAVGEAGHEISEAEAMLRADLVTTWIEASTGLGGLRSGLVGSANAVRNYGHAVVEKPLVFYSAVDDAVRLSSGLMDRVRTAQFERLAEQDVQAAQVEKMTNDNIQPKVSAWVEKMFEQRQAILAVPYREKDRAQDAGAVWHKVKKLWFVPPGVDLALFKAWNPTETTLGPVATKDMLIADFEKAMKDMKLVLPSEIVADCKWHNVAAITTKGTKKSGCGSYLLNLDGGRDGVPCGSISNKSSGERYAWRYEGALLTPEQRAKAKAEAQMREANALREERLQHDLTAVQAKNLWMDCEPSDGHGYAERKGIVADGVRQVIGSRLLDCDAFIGESGRSAIRASEMYSLIPLMTASGEIRNLQAISEDGKVKTFMRGAQKSGLMFVLGAESLDAVIKDNCSLVAYAEGWATGASFQAALPVPVVVCFDAGNMETVVQATMGKFAANTIKVLAVDNDQFHVERALGALSRAIGVNPYSNGRGENVSVISRKGSDGLTGGSTRTIDLGNVVADGEWQQGPKGKYCVTVEHDVDGVSVRSLKVQMVTESGDKTTQLFSNRGAEVGKKCGVMNENCLVVSPWFESLVDMHKDWNDLMRTEGVEVMREQISDQMSHEVFEKTMMRASVLQDVRVPIAETQHQQKVSIGR